MYRSLFSGDLFADMDRLQRQLQQALDMPSPSIRGFAGGFPAVNVGQTPSSTEVYAFVPGVDPATIEITLDRGVLTLTGERAPAVTGSDAKLTLHSNERFDGRFRRVVNLPDDSDPHAVSAACRDGVLHVSVKRREAALPRRIEVQ
ncbi:MAG: heat-shock protein Hsp20 [Leptothrix sp. (in: Bacteria)]|nr:heat-shock protein Hsp20 [Leptothrix sp. (in: b-proteobacteria)]